MPCILQEEDAAAAVQFVNSKFGGMDTLVNGAAGNFLANAAELAPKVDHFVFFPATPPPLSLLPPPFWSGLLDLLAHFCSLTPILPSCTTSSFIPFQ